MNNKHLIIFALLGLILLSATAVKVKTQNSLKKARKSAHVPVSILTQMGEGFYPTLAEYTGRSYDIFYGNPLSDTVDEGFVGRMIFDLTYAEENKTSDDVFYVPNQVITTMDLSCSYSSESKEYSGMKSYQEDLQVAASVKGKVSAGLAKVSFTASAAYSEMEDSVENREEVSIITQAKCSLYKGALAASAQTLSDDFLYAVKKAYTNDDWTTFAEDWGTHYATTVTYGAKAIQRTTFSKEDYQKMTAIGIDVSATVNAKYAGNKLSASAEVNLNTAQSNAYSSTSSTVTASYVGQAPPDSDDIMEWLSQITDGDVKPVPISFELAPIYEVFDPIYFGTELYDEDTLSEMATSLYNAIDEMAEEFGEVPYTYTELGSATAKITASTFYGYTTSTTYYDRTSSYVMLRLSNITYCYSSSLLTGIGISVTDGNFYSAKKTYGTCSGSYTTFTLDDDEQVSTIRIIGSSSGISGLNFFTDKGRTLAIGTMPSSGYTEITMSGDLVGLIVNTNYKVIYGLGFYDKTITFPTTPTVVATKIGTSYGATYSSSHYTFLDPQRTLVTNEMSSITMYCLSSGGVYGIQSYVLQDKSVIANPLRGYSSGTSITYAPSGKINKAVIYYSTTQINSVQFYTEDGSSSTICGSATGTAATVTFASTQELIGFYGSYDSTKLVRLGFLYTE